MNIINLIKKIYLCAFWGMYALFLVIIIIFFVIVITLSVEEFNFSVKECIEIPETEINQVGLSASLMKKRYGNYEIIIGVSGNTFRDTIKYKMPRHQLPSFRFSRVKDTLYIYEPSNQIKYISSNTLKIKKVNKSINSNNQKEWDDSSLIINNSYFVDISFSNDSLMFECDRWNNLISSGGDY